MVLFPFISIKNQDAKVGLDVRDWVPDLLTDLLDEDKERNVRLVAVYQTC
jgi:hypothetical protein